MSVLEVVEVGPQVTIQDQGRRGWAHVGVPRGGALDRPAADLANRLVGNPVGAAVLEILLGGFTGVLHTSRGGCWVATTGAGETGPSARFVACGGRIEIPAPDSGLRTYLAVSGGIDVDPVLGSRSTDTLAGLGPPAVLVGTRLPIGAPHEQPPGLDTPRPPAPGPLRVLPGPHPEFFHGDPVVTLTQAAYVVGAQSNRIGLRLEGAALPRRPGELASEGMVLGAVQIPPDGQPVVLLADHPTTGGYPVAGVVHPEDLWQCAQTRPGEQVRFRRA